MEYEEAQKAVMWQGLIFISWWHADALADLIQFVGEELIGETVAFGVMRGDIFEGFDEEIITDADISEVR